MNVAIICINYFSANDLRKFAASVFRAPNSQNVSLIIVDNSNNTEELNKMREIAASRPEQIKLLNPENNLGYYGAAQFALDYLKESSEFPKWTIISNPDIQVEADFFTNLAELKTGAAVVAPKITSGRNGFNQNPYMLERPSKAKMQFYKRVFSVLPLNFTYQYLSGIKQALFRKTTNGAETNLNPQNCYAAHGSFILFNKSYFTNGGDFKYGSFLFGEEIFVAETCRKLNLRVAYVPTIAVEHREHVSTGLFPKLKTLKLISESSRYCANTYFN